MKKKLLLLNGGSSPRMRGALALRQFKVQGGGIIPAYAGSTEFLDVNWFIGEDHPRVCGEHSRYMIHDLIGIGSSPRMRGAPH